MEYEPYFYPQLEKLRPFQCHIENVHVQKTETDDSLK